MAAMPGRVARRASRVLAGLAGAVQLSLAGAAQAQPAGPGQQEARHPPAADPVETALSEADRLFVGGDLPGALAVLHPVCASGTSAECAFSLGAIHHGLGHCPEALGHYRRYLQLAPRGEHLAEVHAALEEVEARCGAPAPASAATAPLGAPPKTSLGAPPPLAAEPGSGTAPSTVPAPLPVPPVERSSLARDLGTAAFVASGAAALSGVVFGVLAARSARRCQRAEAYDQRFIDECELRGPRYQGLWQGSAIAAGAFLGVGVALWWSDSSARPPAVSCAGGRGLTLSGRF